MLNESNEELARGLAKHRWIDVGNHHLTVRAIKRFIDGALGAHGAWLLEPYADLQQSVGLNVTPLAELTETAELALQHDFQLCVHAIGDRANRKTLDIFEESFKRNPDRRDLRWRIEHAQHLAEPDIPRFFRLGVIASMQPIHATSDGPWVVRRLGERRAEEGAYVWRKLLDSGATIASGTDAPVEDVDPIRNFQAAVSRLTADGTTFYPGQCMTRQEALKSFTLDCAYAAFEEKEKGSLVPGKLADITVLSKDLLTMPVKEIPTAQVIYTIVGGQIRYRANKL
jgi:predicted amidohydrolase YtcJ